ncbi:hypothetical protein [Vibrio phage VP4B]|uniref:Uncharacterized protein n=1 Tax=Vibrio phage VP4B TaxID=1262540 RepID=V9LZP2_9CAUD|nr:hypothetical protein FDJ61_gp051 [Vibrio phage VP4B]AGB07165.1 hypothetical protein [Vibrio phage VP4B]
MAEELVKGLTGKSNSPFVIKRDDGGDDVTVTPAADGSWSVELSSEVKKTVNFSFVVGTEEKASLSIPFVDVERFEDVNYSVVTTEVGRSAKIHTAPIENWGRNPVPHNSVRFYYADTDELIGKVFTDKYGIASIEVPAESEQKTRSVEARCGSRKKTFNIEWKAAGQSPKVFIEDLRVTDKVEDIKVGRLSCVVVNEHGESLPDMEIGIYDLDRLTDVTDGNYESLGDTHFVAWDDPDWGVVNSPRHLMVYCGDFHQEIEVVDGDYINTVPTKANLVSDFSAAIAYGHPVMAEVGFNDEGDDFEIHGYQYGRFESSDSQDRDTFNMRPKGTSIFPMETYWGRDRTYKVMNKDRTELLEFPVKFAIIRDFFMFCPVTTALKNTTFTVPYYVEGTDGKPMAGVKVSLKEVGVGKDFYVEGGTDDRGFVYLDVPYVEGESQRKFRARCGLKDIDVDLTWDDGTGLHPTTFTNLQHEEIGDALIHDIYVQDKDVKQIGEQFIEIRATLLDQNGNPCEYTEFLVHDDRGNTVGTYECNDEGKIYLKYRGNAGYHNLTFISGNAVLTTSFRLKGVKKMLPFATGDLLVKPGVTADIPFFYLDEWGEPVANKQIHCTFDDPTHNYGSSSTDKYGFGVGHAYDTHLNEPHTTFYLVDKDDTSTMLSYNLVFTDEANPYPASVGLWKWSKGTTPTVGGHYGMYFHHADKTAPYTDEVLYGWVCPSTGEHDLYKRQPDENGLVVFDSYPVGNNDTPYLEVFAGNNGNTMTISYSVTEPLHGRATIDPASIPDEILSSTPFTLRGQLHAPDGGPYDVNQEHTVRIFGVPVNLSGGNGRTSSIYSDREGEFEIEFIVSKPGDHLFLIHTSAEDYLTSLAKEVKQGPVAVGSKFTKPDLEQPIYVGDRVPIEGGWVDADGNYVYIEDTVNYSLDGRRFYSNDGVSIQDYTFDHSGSTINTEGEHTYTVEGHDGHKAEITFTVLPKPAE